jgi:ERO1-like protein alpha
MMMTIQKLTLGILLAAILYTLASQREALMSVEMIGRVQGVVGERCCEVDEVDARIDSLGQILSPLTSRYSFFRYFHVDYLKPCTYWPASDEDGGTTEECSLTLDGDSACGICECSDDEIPELLLVRRAREASDCGCIDKTLATEFEEFDDVSNDQWMPLDDDDEAAIFVDLTRNPERYTGYGASDDAESRRRRARAIWLEIYSLCPPGDRCYEESVFHRLMSGLHGSTTAHIAESTGGDALRAYRWLGSRPDLVRNIYFALVFTLRAIDKLEPHYRQRAATMFAAGVDDEDREVRALVDALYERGVRGSCPLFDEQSMFAGGGDGDGDEALLRDSLRAKFQQISAILDCVDCETCKLHARLQLLGIGTALKILLTDNLDAVVDTLQRNELLALFHSANKFAESIAIGQRMRAAELSLVRGAQLQLALLFALFFVVSFGYRLKRTK